jgi:thiol-disulfide isomerase/thioredoxin
MLTPEFSRAKFEAGLAYPAYGATGSPDQQASWNRSYQRVQVTPAQTQLLTSFTRRINLLVTSGTWCGDCVQQVPMLARIAEANPALIHLRLVDRDKHRDLSEQVMICGGLRVPTVIFLSEEFDFVSIMGDKLLTRLRVLAAKSVGAFCPLPGADEPADESAGALRDWVREVERVHLMLRLSPKLREKHGD